MSGAGVSHLQESVQGSFKDEAAYGKGQTLQWHICWSHCMAV